MVTGAAVSSVLSTNGLGTLLGSRKRRLAVNLPEHGRGTATFASTVVVVVGALCVAVAGKSTS